MNEIIVKMPRLPKLRCRKGNRRMNGKKPPSVKLPILKTSPGVVMKGLTAGLISELTSCKKVSIDKVRITDIGKNTTPEKKPIGAGRGGKYYSKNGSHYSHFRESGGEKWKVTSTGI